VRRGVVIALVGLAAALLGATSASAAYHLMKVREVHEGGATEADYVELQMYSGGQASVSGHHVVSYDGAGNQFQTFTFPNSVANGQNQRTILLAGTGMIAATPDFTAPVGNFLPSPDGSVCFIDTLPSNGIDCVSYGVATPPTTNPSPVGAPAGQLAPGQSLERSIAPGCATLLEAGDDTNDSATDFALAPPSPRNNATAPTETACTGGGGGGGGGDSDTAAPRTKITKGPRGEVDSETVKFRFKSSEPGSTFECKLDRSKFKRCTSPKKLRNLDDGRHKFAVRATDAAGNRDPTPKKRRFEVVEG